MGSIHSIHLAINTTKKKSEERIFDDKIGVSATQLFCFVLIKRGDEVTGRCAVRSFLT